MINFDYPSSPGRFYLPAIGLLFGPFDIDLGEPSGVIDMDVPYGSLAEKRGIFGENGVLHTKIDGNVLYSPILSSSVSSADATYPRSLTVTAFSYYYKKVVTERFYDGCPVHGDVDLVERFYNSSYGWIRQFRAFEKVSNGWNVFNLYVKEMYPTKPYAWSIEEVRNFRKSTTTGVYYYDLTTKSVDYGSGIETGVNWINSFSYDGLRYFYKTYGGTLQVYSSSSQISRAYRYDGSLVSPADLRNALLSAVDSSIPELSGVFLIDEIDYGELALEAVRKITVNPTNMLELLRDLRHPTDLVLRLKNLKDLKTWADNYLTVEYGVLPTVSDLETIWKAFKHALPYFDKYGFATYSASKVQTASNSDANYRLEQRLKIAIAKEDDLIIDLYNDLDKWGFYPRLETIWDLLPYSFVIDWFVKVGGLLERLDVFQVLQRLQIRYVTCSSRKSAITTLRGTSALPLLGDISWVQYHRWVSDQCPAPPASPLTLSNPIEHIIDGTALILQRRK